MTNVNCLDGVCCPTCGQEQRFLIMALVDCEVTDDGAWATDNSHYDWDADSPCSCSQCGRNGKFRDFRNAPAEPEAADGPPADHTARRARRLGHVLTWCNDWSSEQEGLIDLLADAMHWCDVRGEDFDSALAQAHRHYLHDRNDTQQHERSTKS